MRTAGKVWGQTTEIERNPTLEIHKILALRGHRCSKHLHQTKFNGFYVIDGTLRVTVWKPDSGTVDHTTLTDGEWMVVAPGQYHQFEAIDDVEAIEVYWSQLEHEDIVREVFGE